MRVPSLFVWFLAAFLWVLVQAEEPASTGAKRTDQNDPTLQDNPPVALSKQFENEKIIASTIRNIVKYASSGFKNGIESSVRSLFDKPMSGAVTAISMLIGAVALLAFYESPISPLPVPPLPDPPVGRFPPEHPIWPPKGKKAPGYKQQYKRTGAHDQAMAYSQIHNSYMYPPWMMMMMNQHHQIPATNFYQHRSDGAKPQPMAAPQSSSMMLQPMPMLYSQKLNQQQQQQLQNFHNHLKQLQAQQQNQQSDSTKVIDYNKKIAAVASRIFNNNQNINQTTAS